MYAAIKSAASGTPPKPDARLDDVSTDLARFGRTPPFDFVAFLLSHYGVFESEPLVLLYGVQTGGDAALLSRAREQLQAALREHAWARVGVGVARAAKRVSVVITMVEGGAVLEPVPRLVPPRGSLTVAGRVPNGFTDPQVIVTTSRGRTGGVPLTALGRGRFSAVVGCADGDGRYQIELAATGSRGPSVLANFPVYCGVDAPASVTIAAPVPADIPADLEGAAKDMLTLINRARSAAGVPPLVWDDRLAAVARAHSAEMAAENRVSHVSPRTGALPDRLLRADLRPVVAAENLGAGPSVAEIHRGIMTSPGHRANVLDPELKAVGVGLAVRRGDNEPAPIFATQVFARWQ